MQSCLEIRQYSWISRFQLFCRHIVTALRDSHSDALLGNLGTGDSHETKNYRISNRSRIFQEGQLVANGIGKNRLKNEALTLSDEFASQRIRHLCGRIWTNLQFAGQHIGIHKAQASSVEMGVVESRLAGAVGSGQRDDNRTAIQRQLHYFAAALLFAFTA